MDLGQIKIKSEALFVHFINLAQVSRPFKNLEKPEGVIKIFLSMVLNYTQRRCVTRRSVAWTFFLLQNSFQSELNSIDFILKSHTQKILKQPKSEIEWEKESSRRNWNKKERTKIQPIKIYTLRFIICPIENF